MSIYTPTAGPWYLGCAMKDSANAVIGDGDSVVALLPGAWNHCTYNPADARLIAAAPAMLAALLAAEREYRDLGEDAPHDPGCIECTDGTVPNNRNTGLCANHHRAIALAKAVKP